MRISDWSRRVLFRSTRMISKTVLATMATALLAATGTAHAFQIDTGNPNLSLRWDNTLRYNLGMRVDKRNDKIANSATTDEGRSEEHTSELQSLMRISYAVFCLQKKIHTTKSITETTSQSNKSSE